VKTALTKAYNRFVMHALCVFCCMLFCSRNDGAGLLRVMCEASHVVTHSFFVVAVYSVAHTSQVLVSELAVKAKKGRAKAGAGETMPHIELWTQAPGHAYCVIVVPRL
jgi:hypothetical protein